MFMGVLYIIKFWNKYRLFMANNTEVVFDNIEQRILKEIEGAHYAIFVSVAWFTNKRLFQALLEKAKANCYVSIIIQLDEINSQSGIDYNQIQQGRSECFMISKDAELLHDKFCVIDFKKVITGSYNWTYKASYNSENILILDDPSVATQYISRFEQQKKTFQNSHLQNKPQLPKIEHKNIKNHNISDITNNKSVAKKQNTIKDYQICPFCKAHNAMEIHYCSKCKKDISTQAVDKNGNGWCDLGLSVLWSTETMIGLYMWNHNSLELSLNSDMSPYYNFTNFDNKDIATLKWGAKWRTPTKDEFEELIKKCRWEKFLTPSNKHALKITGPNGNSIILPVTGNAGCLRKSSLEHFLGEDSLFAENIYNQCTYWTSSEATHKSGYSYAFYFKGYRNFQKTLTAKEKKEQEFKSNSLFSSINNKAEWGTKQWFENEAKREEEEKMILSEMGNDFNERWNNQKKDHERRHALWLEAPIELFYDMDKDYKNTIKPIAKNSGLAIRPVADKKWKGKL